MAGTIVCGVDGSPAAVEAARVATDLGEQLDLRVVLVHVADGFTSDHARVGGERLVKRMAAEQGLDEIEARIEVGDPAEWLAQVAAEERAALILVGARSRRRPWRTLLRRDLARDLAGVTPCPVLVVPPKDTGRRHAEPLRLAAV